ncbi:MAG: ornithine cyclodeaminase family protein [Steroidobacter sp.]
MRIVELPEILAALDEDSALAAVEQGFRRFSRGEAQVTAVGHLGFNNPPGDCHVKSAHLAGDDLFVVKVASSFYRNTELGLPSSNGFMAVISAKTGEVLGLLHDRGHLTDQRTAMAGAIAGRAILRPGSTTLGIVGSGTQARMQGQLISRRLGLSKVLVWARNEPAAARLATELGGEAVGLRDLCERADLIVTTTPSTAPLIATDMIQPGKRIVAVGADSPEKRELDPRILARGRVVVDSLEQCIDHGEAGWAVRAGLVDATTLIELGALLSSPVAFSGDEIVVADLTGVAVQDVAITKSVWSRLAS